MSTHLSTIGLFHTAVSLVSIGSGAYAYFRDGKIDQKNWLGKTYMLSMLIASATAFGTFRHGTFSLGHGLTLVTIAVLLVALFAERIHWLRSRASQVEAVSLATSFLLLMIFATTETLTRLPAGHPVAAGPQAPILASIHGMLFVGFFISLYFQIPKLPATSRQ